MVQQLKLPVKVMGVPTVREANGLALSSRNQRLSDEEEENASAIYRILRESTSLMSQKSPNQISSWVKEAINNVTGLRVEYFAIVTRIRSNPSRTGKKRRGNRLYGRLLRRCATD